MGRIVTGPKKTPAKRLTPAEQAMRDIFANATTGRTADETPSVQGTIDTTTEGDNYLTRVAKYIPAEVIAFFIFVNSIVSDALDKFVAAHPVKEGETLTAARDAAQMAGISLSTIAWAILLLSMLVIPFYLIASRDKSVSNERIRLNIVMAVLAFPVWAYAVDAVAFRSFHDGALASILIAVFSVVSGVISPELIDNVKAFFKSADDMEAEAPAPLPVPSAGSPSGALEPNGGPAPAIVDPAPAR